MRNPLNTKQMSFGGVVAAPSSDSGSIEAELAWLALAAARMNARNAQIYIERMGWSGKGAKTLQKVADKFSLTRERVRQIESAIAKRLARTAIDLPYLQRALSLIGPTPFVMEQVLQGRLRDASISRGMFNIDGVLTAARAAGMTVRMLLVRGKGGRILVGKAIQELPNWFVSTSRAISSRRGVVNLLDLKELAEAEFREPIAESQVRDFLMLRNDVAWLDEGREWFFLVSSKRNRLENLVRKVLAVTRNIKVTDMRDGIRREHRMHGFAPPANVLSEFCRQIDGVIVEGDRVRADPPIAPESAVSESELLLTSVLKEYGGVQNRAELERECVARGMNVSTFYVRLGYSSLVERLAAGVYAIRGASVEAGQVEGLQIPVRPSEALQDFGWTGDAKVWIGYRLTHGISVSGVISVPTGMKEMLQGDFVLAAPDGATFGPFKCSGSQAWSLGKFFRRRGGDEGEFFVLLWDLDQRTVTVFLGASSVEDIDIRVGAEDVDD